MVKGIKLDILTQPHNLISANTEWVHRISFSSDEKWHSASFTAAPYHESHFFPDLAKGLQ